MARKSKLKNAPKRKMNAASLQNLRPIKKGEVRNPKGISEAPEIREIRAMTTAKMQEIGKILLSKNYNELVWEFQNNGEMTVMERMMAAIALKTMKGDAAAFNALVDRLHGKVVQKQEITGADGKPLETRTVTVNSHEIKTIVKKLDDEY